MPTHLTIIRNIILQLYQEVRVIKKHRPKPPAKIVKMECDSEGSGLQYICKSLHMRHFLHDDSGQET